MLGLRAVIVGVCLVAMHACQKSSDVPTAPGTIAASQTTVGLTVCHRTGDGGTYIRMSISSGDVAAHLAHGDAPVGDMVPGQSGQRFDAQCNAIAMAPVSVSFRELAVNGEPFVSYLENGINVAAESAPWEAMTGYGSPAPAIIFRQAASVPPTTGVVQVTMAGELFAFASVDVYSSVTTIPYTIVGTRNGQRVFSMSATVPNTFGRFATIVNSAPLMVTELRIELTQPFLAFGSNPMGLDNITIKR